MKVLILGLPGGGKTTLAASLAKLIEGTYINADEVRTQQDDWDFTPAGRLRQAMRLRELADSAVGAGEVAIIDTVCPTERTREIIAPDFTVWMDTIEASAYEDTNKMFEKPKNCDVHVTEHREDTPSLLAQRIRAMVAEQNKDV